MMFRVQVESFSGSHNKTDLQNAQAQTIQYDVFLPRWHWLQESVDNLP